MPAAETNSPNAPRREPFEPSALPCQRPGRGLEPLPLKKLCRPGNQQCGVDHKLTTRTVTITCGKGRLAVTTAHGTPRAGDTLQTPQSRPSAALCPWAACPGPACPGTASPAPPAARSGRTASRHGRRGGGDRTRGHGRRAGRAARDGGTGRAGGWGGRRGQCGAGSAGAGPLGRRAWACPGRSAGAWRRRGWRYACPR